MSNTSQIRFAPDILRRLGEELNPHPAFGIIELVKNAYDADATNCEVTLDQVDEPGGAVIVSDDGDGMTPSQIEHGWLVVGQSQKQKRRRTKLGRIPAGSKGLGRLAALRLGRFARLETSPRNASDSHRLIIDWKLFDKASLINDVDLEIESFHRKPKQTHGTTIHLERLQSRIGRQEVKRLARAMLLLADPFGSNVRGFQPRLIAPEFSDLERLVSRRYFDQASYHLIAKIDNHGRGSVTLQDFRGENLFSGKHQDLVPNMPSQRFDCPQLEFELWTFILNSQTFANLSVTVKEVRAWLAEFGGVHIYHNDIRVAPYGDVGHDWLSMNLSRVRSPEERPSTNNSIGRFIIHDQQERLIQKTDRSGFIEGLEFDEIRRFGHAALDWMATRRLELAVKRRTKNRVEAPKKSEKTKLRLEAIVKAAPRNIRPKLEAAVEQHDRAKEREIDELKKEVQLYRTLSTAGITASTFAHESTGNPVKVIRASISTIERRAKDALPNDYDNKLKPPVERVKASIESLSVLDTATLSLLDHEKRRLSKVDVNKTIRSVLSMFRPFLLGRNVNSEVDLAPGSPYMLGTEAAMESIITNLINNGMVALEEVPQAKRRLLIRTVVNAEIVTLSVSDSGKGFRDIRMSDIWLPGKTTKRNGTGLGLTIVKDTVTDLGGTVGAIDKCDLGGAEVYVELPIIGA
jgi:signal transduction histidine kinase